jgi:hypothetical protein
MDYWESLRLESMIALGQVVPQLPDDQLGKGWFLILSS